MASQRQRSLLPEPPRDTKRWWIVKKHVYGGSLNYRKCKRPFDKNKLVHIVLKAQDWACFHQRSQEINERVILVAKKSHVQINDLAINKNHIHLLVTTKKREFFLNFLRQVAASLGHLMKAILHGLEIKKTENLWIGRPFTRLVQWGKRSVVNIKNYISRNRKEVMGFIPYQRRNHSLESFLLKWSSTFSSA